VAIRITKCYRYLKHDTETLFVYVGTEGLTEACCLFQVGFSLHFTSTLKTEATYSSETSDDFQTTTRNFYLKCTILLFIYVLFYDAASSSDYVVSIAMMISKE
jgi:hypothetical protein